MPAGEQGAGAGAQNPVALLEQMTRMFSALTEQMRSLGNDATARQPFYELYKTTPLTGAEDQDCPQFFEQFEYLSGLVPGMTEAIQLAELKKCLRDRALAVYQAGQPAEVRTYAALKEYLLTNLVLPHQRSVYRHSFHSRQKDEKETVNDYYRDLQRLAKLAYSDQTDEARCLVVKERFIAGLQVTDKGHPNFKIWKAAFQAATGTLANVLAAAQMAETSMKTLSLVSDVATGLSNQGTTRALNAVAGLVSTLPGETGHGGQSDRGHFHGRGGRYNSGYIHGGQFRGRASGRSQTHDAYRGGANISRGGANSHAHLQCNHCRQWGHIRRECPNLEFDRNRGRGTGWRGGRSYQAYGRGGYNSGRYNARGGVSMYRGQMHGSFPSSPGQDRRGNSWQQGPLFHRGMRGTPMVPRGNSNGQFSGYASPEANAYNDVGPGYHSEEYYPYQGYGDGACASRGAYEMFSHDYDLQYFSAQKRSLIPFDSTALETDGNDSKKRRGDHENGNLMQFSPSLLVSNNGPDDKAVPERANTDDDISIRRSASPASSIASSVIRKANRLSLTEVTKRLAEKAQQQPHNSTMGQLVATTPSGQKTNQLMPQASPQMQNSAVSGLMNQKQDQSLPQLDVANMTMEQKQQWYEWATVLGGQLLESGVADPLEIDAVLGVGREGNQ